MNTRPVLLEVCVDSAADAVAAARGGADRVELCSGLIAGGLTPGPGTILVARRRLEIAMMVMVRPRGGDFLYDALEFEVMQQDVRAAKAAGADGVVFGLLNPDGTIDEERTARLTELARPLQVTFHRAFDMTRDPFEALETLAALGVDRVLTSGQETSVAAGLGLLADLVARAAERIVVMPGCGIRTHNVRQVLAVTGAREIHFTAEATRPSGMQFRNERCRMGGSKIPGEFERLVTDAERVQHFVTAVRGVIS